MTPVRRSLAVLAVAGAAALATPPALAATPAVATPPAARQTDDSCPAGQYGTNRFTDLPASDLHADDVTCIVWWALADGTSATTYDPSGTVTRGQMATFVARLVTHSGGALEADPPDAFPDDDGSVHAHNIDQLAAAGIVSGRPDGTFGADEPVTRGQLAAFLVRAYGYRTGTPLVAAADFFADDAGSPFEDAINTAATARFTGGYPDGRYRPNVAVTREQMATFLARALDALVENGFATTPPPVRTPPPPSGGWTRPTTASLSAGDHGVAVTAAQQRLTALGYWLGPADGSFGELTTQAVYALQKAAGLNRDGVIGARTWEALEHGVRPPVTSTQGHVAEVDLGRQLLEIVTNGHLDAVLNTSTGSGRTFLEGGEQHVAVTPTGHYRVFRQVDAWDSGPLGSLYRPKYFQSSGIAVHGYPDVPPYPASHGCVRVSIAAMDWIWRTGQLPIGTPVWVR